MQVECQRVALGLGWKPGRWGCLIWVLGDLPSNDTLPVTAKRAASCGSPRPFFAHPLIALSPAPFFFGNALFNQPSSFPIPLKTPGFSLGPYIKVFSPQALARPRGPQRILRALCLLPSSFLLRFESFRSVTKLVGGMPANSR